MFLIRKDDFSIATLAPCVSEVVDKKRIISIEESEMPEWLYHLMLTMARCEELDAVVETEGESVTLIGTRVYDAIPSDTGMKVEIQA
jgi:hypothetical protein